LGNRRGDCPGALREPWPRHVLHLCVDDLVHWQLDLLPPRPSHGRPLSRQRRRVHALLGFDHRYGVQVKFKPESQIAESSNQYYLHIPELLKPDFVKTQGIPS
jgi:hypothetical protein